MSIEGFAIVNKAQPWSSSVVYVEYHRCDHCGVEFRLYHAGSKTLKEAVDIVAKKLNRDGQSDLCHKCQSDIPGDQIILPLEI